MIIALTVSAENSSEVSAQLAEIDAARANNSAEHVVLSDSAARAIAGFYASPDGAQRAAMASLATGYPRDHRVIAQAIEDERNNFDYDASVGRIEHSSNVNVQRELRALGAWLHETVCELSEAGQPDDGYLAWLDATAGEVLAQREGSGARTADELDLVLASDLLDLIEDAAQLGDTGRAILGEAMQREGSDLAQGCTLTAAGLTAWATRSRDRLTELSVMLRSTYAGGPMGGHWDYFDAEHSEEYFGEVQDTVNVLTDYAAALQISVHSEDGYIIECDADAAAEVIAYL